MMPLYRSAQKTRAKRRSGPRAGRIRTLPPGARVVSARSSHEAANDTNVFARAKPSRTRCGPGRPALRFSSNRPQPGAVSGYTPTRCATSVRAENE